MYTQTTNPKNVKNWTIYDTLYTSKEFKMKATTFCEWMLVAVLALALLLTGCASGDGPFGASAPASVQSSVPVVPTQSSIEADVPEPTPSLDPASPQGVAVHFYEAYCQAAERGLPGLDQLEADTQALLSDTYLTQLAEIRAGFEGSGFDPILQAQMVPPGPVEVKESLIEGDLATVVLQFGADVMEQPWERTVSLERINGQWQIVPDRVEGGGLNSEETVQAFYDWYLAYIRGSGEFRNPLVDRAYRAAPYLEASLVHRMDRLVEEGLVYDPFLCGQDVPETFQPVASFDNHAHPIVLLESSFPGHYLTADLVCSNFNQWAIRKITCGGSPEGLAKAFYTWTLDTMTGSGEFYNPWINGDHQASPFLSQGFIQELDQLLASGEPILADPVFLAQDLPALFNTAPCPQADCALVNLQYGEGTIRQLQLDLVEENGGLKIDRISNPAELEIPEPGQSPESVDRWLPFLDEQYGYGFRYPASWTLQSDPVISQHSPQDFPRMRSSIFAYPQASPDIAVLIVDVIIGDRETALAFAGGGQIEETLIHGHPASLVRSDPGILAYVIQHPARIDTWLVVSDPVTQFPGREALAEGMPVVLDALLSTLTFSQEVPNG
jgi:hypothetical protein